MRAIEKYASWKNKIDELYKSMNMTKDSKKSKYMAHKMFSHSQGEKVGRKIQSGAQKAADLREIERKKIQGKQASNAAKYYLYANDIKNLDKTDGFSKMKATAKMLGGK